MYVKQPKKLLILNILDILRKYTDEDHRLSQKEIAEILKNEYDMKADRKAIRRNLLNLMDCGYEIEYSETIRNVPVKDKKTGEVLRDKDTGEPVMEENELWSDFYLKRQFTDGELRLLIDSLLFSRHIPYSQCKDLVEKLEDLLYILNPESAIFPHCRKTRRITASFFIISRCWMRPSAKTGKSLSDMWNTRQTKNCMRRDDRTGVSGSM